jgi:hypothetical protein
MLKTVGTNTPTNRTSRKHYEVSRAGDALRSLNTGSDAQMLQGITDRLCTDGTHTVRLLG